MKTVSLRRSFLLPVFVLAFPLLNAHASGGVIHFQGAIVEEGCRLSNQEHSVKFSCTQNGEPVVQTIALNKLNNYTAGGDAPFSTKMRYIDAQHQLAVLEITYR
ncbi:hypothetical protein M977_03657 [Buttiauxella gaviniae ATCC 51604]|uniref:Type 1 fimbrial protein n=1 Tax=Buttiauxella gaviniae ATCC 51604 TaxID=1354253 RepID=A0A1B7HR70_9ENTR|nr:MULTISPECIES: hypothetical protein [Buttiauxella]OAT18136.1 hypothetical protein M977_03657 [Buttiauxella gaviniae ATCC 51604]TDX18661.1 hypothetical protein EDF88_1149 [Buttiauxella sp. BIGb0552]